MSNLTPSKNFATLLSRFDAEIADLEAGYQASKKTGDEHFANIYYQKKTGLKIGRRYVEAAIDAAGLKASVARELNAMKKVAQ